MYLDGSDYHWRNNNSGYSIDIIHMFLCVICLYTKNNKQYNAMLQSLKIADMSDESSQMFFRNPIKS